MFLFVQYSLNSSLSISSLDIHLSMLENCLAITSRLILLSNSIMCFFRNLIGPLSWVSFIEC